MDKKKIITEVTYLPKRILEQNVSIFDFLKRIDYFEFYDRINEKNIEDSLTKNPECIKLWLQYSAKQKQGLAWQFIQSGGNDYEVAFHNRDEAELLHKFTDANKACAFYIGTVLERMKGDYLLDKIGFPEIIGIFRKEKIINEIAYMPKRLNDLRHVSTCEFLKRLGYFKFHERINEKNIEDFLIENPECIKLWLQYSADQRRRTAWYFIRSKSVENAYEVAHNSEKGIELLHEFSDANKACAFFIKREIEDAKRVCSSQK